MNNKPERVADVLSEEKYQLLRLQNKDSVSNSLYNTLIESLGVYLPSNAVSTRDVMQGCKKPIMLPLEYFTGIKTRRVADKGEFSIDLAKKAIDNCLAHSKYQPTDLEMLISANCSRYDGPAQFSFEPSTAIKLKEHFGFDNALVFDVTNACAGMFTAIYIVDAFIKAGIVRCGMVVSGEYITHITHTAQHEIDSSKDPRLACLTLGDAGAAVILERSSSEKIGFHDMDIYILGQYSSYCLAKPTDGEHGGVIMHTEMTKLAAVGIKQSVIHASQLLKRVGMSLDEFQHIIPHQTSRMYLSKVAREISRVNDKEVRLDGKLICNLAERGNTASTSHFVALNDAILNNRIASGDNVIFSITASGLTIGTALYTFDDLPDRLRLSASSKQEPHRVKTGLRNTSTLNPRTSKIRIESVGTILETSNTGRDAVELVCNAAEQCFKWSSYHRSDVELLIYTGVYRNDFISEPAIAAMIMDKLGINHVVQSPEAKKTLAFDIFNGSIGFLNACYIASEIIKAGRCKNAMIVASEIENNAEVCPNTLRGLNETGSAIILDENTDRTVGFGNFFFKYFTNQLDTFTSYATQEKGKTYYILRKTRNW